MVNGLLQVLAQECHRCTIKCVSDDSLYGVEAELEQGCFQVPHRPGKEALAALGREGRGQRQCGMEQERQGRAGL